MIISDGFRFPTIYFPNKEAKEQYEKAMSNLGFHEIVSTPTISTNEVKYRRFVIK